MGMGSMSCLLKSNNSFKGTENRTYLNNDGSGDRKICVVSQVRVINYLFKISVYRSSNYQTKVCSRPCNRLE